jgi:hypothetical protein
MSEDFHDRLVAVHDEVQRAGSDASEALERKLGALATADLPEGVRRLPTARMRPGPHLGPQDGSGSADTGTSRRRRSQAGRGTLAAR